MSEKKQYIGEYIQKLGFYQFNIEYESETGNGKDVNGAFTIHVLLNDTVHILFSKQYEGKEYLLYYVGIKFGKSIYGQWVQKEDKFNNGYFWMSEDTDISDENRKKCREFLVHINQSELETLLYRQIDMQITDKFVNSEYYRLHREEIEDIRDAGLVPRMGDADECLATRLVKENLVYKKTFDFIKPLVENIKKECKYCANLFKAFDVIECGLGEEKECIPNNKKFFKSGNDFLEILLKIKDMIA